MREFSIVVLGSGLFGGLAAYALLPLVAGTIHEQKVGPITVQTSVPVFSRDQLLIGIFMASLCGAMLAYGMAWTSRRRRRR